MNSFHPAKLIIGILFERYASFAWSNSSKKTRVMVKNNTSFLHHDYAPVHISLVLRDHFANISTRILLQPPGLAPYGFPKLKRPLWGTRFELIAIWHVYRIGKKRWHKCIVSEGDYLKRNEIDLEKYIKIFYFTNKFTLHFDHGPF